MTPKGSKGGLGEMLKGGSPMPDDDEGAEGGDDYEEGKTAAAQAALDAFKSGDAAALSSALTDFVNLCS